MNLLFQLFFMFARLCTFAFGGGYVMFPSMIKASEQNGWGSASELTNIIAIAGMSPGPVAVNAAVGLGYKVAGVPGAIAACLGIAVPCAVIVVIVATFFFKAYNHPIVQYALNGLRPVITGIILYAGISIALKNGMLGTVPAACIQNGIYISLFGGFFELKSLLIAAATFLILLKTKVQPVFIIAAAGFLGVFIF
ncbi:MAG: chromate transporter [Clostridia bacterium]|nr:chromate transporter [Clostridia bacterium]